MRIIPFYILMLLLSMLSISKGFTQSKNYLDSLTNLLKRDLAVTQRITIYNKLLSEYSFTDSLKTMKYAKQMKNYAKTNGKPEFAADATIHQANLFLNQGYYQEADYYFKKALKTAKKYNKQEQIAKIYLGQGILYDYKGIYQNALTYYQKALTIGKKIEGQVIITRAYINIGVIYFNRGNYYKALNYYHRALKISEKLKDNTRIVAVCINIGLIYRYQMNYKKALDYFERAADTQKSIDNNARLIDIYSNIASIRKAQKNYKKSLEYYQKALKIAQDVNDQQGIAYNYGNIGSLFHEQGNYQQALEWFQKSLKIVETLGDKYGIAYSHNVIGISHYEQQNYQEAQQYLEKGLVLGLAIQNIEIVRDVSSYLSKIYEQQGNFKKAYQMHTLFKQMTDSLFNQQNTRELTRLEDKYIFEKKEDSLKLIQAQKTALLNADIDKRKVTQNFTFLALGLTSLLVILLFVFYREKRKANHILQLAHQEVKTSNDLLQDNLKTIAHQRDDIMSSITYAQRIQAAVLPSKKAMKATLPDSFILFRPRDIVSGDFYWFEETEQHQFIIAADCTGHGVPGAFMTMLGIQALTDIIIQKKIYSPDKILKALDLRLRTLLENDNQNIQDGMDITIAVVDKSSKKLLFSGAKNSLIIIQNERLKEFRGCPFSINSSAEIALTTPFVLKEFDLGQATTFYMYSDGYQDQFGGTKGKKFMKKRFRELLYSIHQKPLTEQQTILNNTLEEWMQDYEQIDDILVLGVNISSLQLSI